MHQTEPSTSSKGLPLFRHFTVGWITAIETEFLAAKQLLDMEYDARKIALPTGDKNIYTLGRIGEHNVVIATLPPAIYGTRSATGVAHNLQRHFPMVRVVLMVGVGGGAPTVRAGTGSDVRLGDVVVGTRVVSYDFGKQHPNYVEYTGDVKLSNSTLLSMTRQVTRDMMHDKLDLESTIAAGFTKTARIQDLFSRPGEESDRLYRPDYCHNDSEICDCLCETPRELDMIIPRAKRKSYDRIKVHYGSIGSADTVVKDAITRDKLALQHNLLCFEMETAGIIPIFRHIIPIRGICDYSDSHKAKQWQGYAAAAAATYAKCFLNVIDPHNLDADIPPNVDEMERYVQLVIQMVERVTSTRSYGPGSGSGLNEADNAMREIRESVAMLTTMAEHNSDSIRGVQKGYTEHSAALKNAEDGIKRIEEGQRDMRKILDDMMDYISTQHAVSTEEQKPGWENLRHEATEETSSLEKATKITENAREAMGKVADFTRDASWVTNSGTIARISDTLGRGSVAAEIGVNGFKKVKKWFSFDDPSPDPSSPRSSSSPEIQRRIPKPVPSTEHPLPPPTRIKNPTPLQTSSPPKSSSRTSSRVSSGVPQRPPLPPRDSLPSARSPSSGRQSTERHRIPEARSRDIAAHVSGEASRRLQCPPALPDRPRSVSRISSSQSEGISGVTLPRLPPRPQSSLQVSQQPMSRGRSGNPLAFEAAFRAQCRLSV